MKTSHSHTARIAAALLALSAATAGLTACSTATPEKTPHATHSAAKPATPATTAPTQSEADKARDDFTKKQEAGDIVFLTAGQTAVEYKGKTYEVPAGNPAPTSVIFHPKADGTYDPAWLYDGNSDPELQKAGEEAKKQAEQNKGDGK